MPKKFHFTKADYKRAAQWRATHPYMRYIGRVRLVLVNKKRPISAAEFSLWLRRSYRDYKITRPRYKAIVAAIFEGAGDKVSNIKITANNIVTFNLSSRSRDRLDLLRDLRHMATASSSAQKRLEWYDSIEDERTENNVATVGAASASLLEK